MQLRIYSFFHFDSLKNTYFLKDIKNNFMYS